MTFPLFDASVFVCADRTRLKQIIINLVSNAIKYNKEHGTVVVECTTSAPERIRFNVKDSGAGLSSEKLAQLFQPFNRLGQEAGSVAGTGHWSGYVKTFGGVDGRRRWCGKHGWGGERILVQIESYGWLQVTVGIGEAEALTELEMSVGAPRHTLLYVEDNPANMELVEELIGRFPDMGLGTAVNGMLARSTRSRNPRIRLPDVLFSPDH